MALYWKDKLICGGVEPTEEDSAPFRWEAFLNCDEGESTEKDSQRKDLTVCSAADSKGAAQLENKRRFTVAGVDADIWSDLNDDLVEKIIARLPLRTLFQAATLSKAWNLRFRSDSFQKEVSGLATSWTYAPVLHNGKNGLVGYERRSKRWYKLPTISRPPQFPKLGWDLRAVDGSLFCWTSVARSGVHAMEVFVTNPLTGSWKQLPPRLNTRRAARFVHLVLGEGGKAYKVIIGNQEVNPWNDRYQVVVEIFDSTDGAWTVESVPTSLTEEEEDIGSLKAAVVNGVFHVAVEVEFISFRESSWRTGSQWILISFDVEQKVWKEQRRIFQVSKVEFQKFSVFEIFDVELRLVGWGQKVMLVAHWRMPGDVSVDDEDKDYILSVYTLDADSGLAIEVSRAPAVMVGPYFEQAVCNGDCIYIATSSPNCIYFNQILYNVGTQEWHWLVTSAPGIFHRFNGVHRLNGEALFNRKFSDGWEWMSWRYRPGWNPFLKV